jgi:DNA-binding transcriptional LysR family regulator
MGSRGRRPNSPIDHSSGSQVLSGDRVPLSGPGGRFEVPVRVAFLANHWRPLRQALLAGIGIGGVQYPIAAEALDSGELVPVLTDWEHDPQEVHAIYPAGRHVPEKTRMLAAVLEKSLSPLLAD